MWTWNLERKYKFLVKIENNHVKIKELPNDEGYTHFNPLGTRILLMEQILTQKIIRENTEINEAFYRTELALKKIDYYIENIKKKRKRK